MNNLTDGKLPPITLSSLDVDRLRTILVSDEYKEAPGVGMLHNELERASVVPPEAVPPTLVTMNSKVWFMDEMAKDEYGMNLEYGLTLVYPGPDNSPGTVSVLTPVGSALLGLSVGQKISWPMPHRREMCVRVLKLLYQPESNGEYHR
jgi:regulator of nucleoside diphosphate kinase